MFPRILPGGRYGDRVIDEVEHGERGHLDPLFAESRDDSQNLLVQQEIPVDRGGGSMKFAFEHFGVSFGPAEPSAILISNSFGPGAIHVCNSSAGISFAPISMTGRVCRKSMLSSRWYAAWGDNNQLSFFSFMAAFG